MRWWIWTFLGLFGGLHLLIGFAFFYIPALERINEKVSCGPDEIIVSERQERYHNGQPGHATRSCCAHKDDKRKFGKCYWGNSASWKDVKPMAMPFYLALYGGVPLSLLLTLLIYLLVRRRKRRLESEAGLGR